MTDERTMLGRIAAQLRRPHPDGAHEPGPRTAQPEVPRDRAALVARFRNEWEALAGHVHAVASEQDAVDVVVGICRAHASTRVLTWTGAAVGIPALDARLEAAHIAADYGWLPDEAGARAGRLKALAAITVGITGADALLAESGSVVVVSGPGRGRLASLLPPVHVTIARTGNIHQSLQHLFDAQPSLVDRGSNLVAISGPSRTADIEMTLTRGVHGPGEVHVILLGA